MGYREEPAPRAKLFMPFDALKGFREALAEKERILVAKPDLSEEKLEDLNRSLQELTLGDMVTMIYFQAGEYVNLSGLVARIDTDNRKLQIVTTWIGFDDILELKHCWAGDRIK